MKALTQSELQTFVSTFKPQLEGAQLQEVLVSDRGLALGFHRESTKWLILDLVPNSPMILLFEKNNPFKKGPKPKPVGLFLNSHARNLYVVDIRVEEKWGRLVKLILKNTHVECELEIRLIPRQCNLLVSAEGKHISWAKPLDLSEPPHVENPPEPRSMEAIYSEWLEEQQGGAKRSSLDPVAQWEKQRQKDLEKKKKALNEIEKQLSEKKEVPWFESGDFLKTHGHLDVPAKLQAFVDASHSLSWNIENCFTKAKQIVGKKEGARERLEELSIEIAALEKAQYKSSKNGNGQQKLVDLMHKAKARGRKLELESGALAYCGKSAADNLALLRQAKAWDYWLHLKDYPGAHAIIHRERQQEIPVNEIQDVAAWLAKESLASKSFMVGQKVAIVIVECRFVRPIKGDRLGRVTYHSEKTFHFSLRQV
jgi:predicted ribosome quality control (RQC) complex YloA/Tae2 family protein